MSPPSKCIDCPHEDRIEKLCCSVAEIKEGLLGCVETGKTGMIARVENLEAKVDAVLGSRKFKLDTAVAAIIGAVVAAIVGRFTGSN